MNLFKPELLAPAGSRENAFFALEYGADAIYQGLSSFSLRRTIKSELNIEDLQFCVELAHKYNKKHYLAINIFAHEKDLDKLISKISEIKFLETDAFIVADPGILFLLRDRIPNKSIHLSTQANTLNSESIKFWQQQGVSRINIARELNKNEISLIRKKTDMELEIFVHGAMCMSYSGRCHLSKFFLNRDANQGECAQPCRWEYLQKDNSSNNYNDSNFIDIEEDDRGTYIMNSKDLCLIDSIDDLIKMQINSLKIEGRNKTSYYVANVVRVYRAVIDEICLGSIKESTMLWAKKELSQISHREYSTGFYDGEKGSFNFSYSGYIKKSKMVAICHKEDNKIILEVRDQIKKGDTLAVIIPCKNEAETFFVDKMYDYNTSEELLESHNGSKVYLLDSESKISSLKNKCIVRKEI
jgi:U32 family peptidase